MLLAIDIGNTSIVFGVFRGDRLIRKDRMPTGSALSSQKCRGSLENLFRGRDIDEVIISSVVPDALGGLEKVLKKIFNKKPFVVGRDIRAPIKNLYKKPQQVGQDRLVNAVAAAAIYNKGKKDHLVVVDFGTAVTFDVISRKDEYLGGVIFPGIRLSLENLVRRAALLPKITIKEPESLIGRDTKDSMRSGILNGYGSLCEGMISRIESFLNSSVKVIATGGDAGLIAKYCRSIQATDADLTLKGLRIIAKNFL